MARRDRFVRHITRNGQKGRSGARPYRDPGATVWVAMVAFVCAFAVAVVLGCQSAVALASAHETKASDGRPVNGLEALVLERDSFGRVRLAGAEATPRLVPAALKKEISVLREHRDRVREQRWPDLRHRPFPKLPIADDAPPRMDRGGSDPDRLLPPSRPVVEEVR